jgi:histidyl-tRNA synthetase
MDAEVERLGLNDKKLSVFRLIDRQDKMSPEAWSRYAGELGLTDADVAGLRRLLDNREIWLQSEECADFVKAADALGIAEFLEYDPTVIRGLDYYTGTVIEAHDRKGEFRSILGGGRYDNLVGDVGGDPLPGIGFAMGDNVLGLLVQAYNKVPTFRPSPAEVLVTTFDAAGTTEALRLASELRAAGLKVEWYPQPSKLDRQLKYADANGIRFAAITGPDELERGVVTLKDLGTREQTAINRDAVAAELRKKIGLEAVGASD